MMQHPGECDLRLGIADVQCEFAKSLGDACNGVPAMTFAEPGTACGAQRPSSVGLTGQQAACERGSGKEADALLCAEFGEIGFEGRTRKKRIVGLNRADAAMDPLEAVPDSQGDLPAWDIREGNVPDPTLTDKPVKASTERLRRMAGAGPFTYEHVKVFGAQAAQGRFSQVPHPCSERARGRGLPAGEVDACCENEVPAGNAA